MGADSPELPFGGVKNSGFGREKGGVVVISDIIRFQCADAQSQAASKHGNNKKK